MKKYKNILVDAQSNSEWDGCDYALIPFDKQDIERWINILEQLQKLTAEIKEEATLTLYDHDAIYYNNIEQNEKIEVDRSGWVLIDLSYDELESLSVPEQKLDCHRTKITSSGYVYFTAYGKYTSEEFFTDEILIEDLKKLL